MYRDTSREPFVNVSDVSASMVSNFGAQTSETFTNGSREVSLYIASYPMKRRGVELVNAANVVAPGEWYLLTGNYREATIASESVRVAQYLLAHGGGQRRIVWMWYLTGDKLTASLGVSRRLKQNTGCLDVPRTWLCLRSPRGLTPSRRRPLTI